VSPAGWVELRILPELAQDYSGRCLAAIPGLLWVDLRRSQNGHNRSVAIFPQSRPSRSVSGAFRFKAILALPALSRRPEDHRRHRRACGDCQGYSRTWACLYAPPRSPARPLALFQAGLILKAKAVLQCPDDPARPALACSGQTVSKRFGPIQGSNNHREREIFTKHRAIDRLSGRRYSQSRTGKR